MGVPIIPAGCCEKVRLLRVWFVCSCLVCLVCLVEPDYRIDERNQTDLSDEPRLTRHVSRSVHGDFQKGGSYTAFYG